MIVHRPEDCHRDKVKRRTESLSRAEPKFGRAVRKKERHLPVLMPRLFQAMWQKLEGGHGMT